MTLADESDALHARVRRFAERAAAGADPEESFDALALAVADHQANYVPGFRRLVEARGARLGSVSDIPAVPVDAFRAARVAAHPPHLDEAVFETSGTTGGARGVHAMRTTRTYRALALLSGRAALVEEPGAPRVVVALAPAPGASPSSSLGFMLRAFMEEFDGRALGAEARFDAAAPGRWLAGPGGVDVEGLRRAAGIARDRGEPLLVLATGFALSLLIEAVRGGRVEAPERTVVMPTGGMKGRAAELTPGALAEAVAGVFGIPATRVVGEYGMTELTSQLYDAAAAGRRSGGEPGTFLPPPWLRVAAVDPVTLGEVPPGDEGIARFVDLGNVDSAVAIVTEDRVRVTARGVELRGRREGAPPRGCSLALAEMVLGREPP